MHVVQIAHEQSCSKVSQGQNNWPGSARFGCQLPAATLLCDVAAVGRIHLADAKVGASHATAATSFKSKWKIVAPLPFLSSPSRQHSAICDGRRNPRVNARNFLLSPRPFCRCMHRALFAGRASISSRPPTLLRLQLLLHLSVVLFSRHLLLHNDNQHHHINATPGHDPRILFHTCLRFAFCSPFWSGHFRIFRTIYQDDKPQPTGHTIRQVPLSSLFTSTCLLLAIRVAEGGLFLIVV